MARYQQCRDSKCVVRRAAMAFCAAGVSLAVVGCASQPLRIAQDAIINNASDYRLRESERETQPLEVAIVCVRAEDFENPVNELLRPENNISCRQWYDRRPNGDQGDPNRFVIPQSRIFWLTDRPQADVYGQRKGPALKGAGVDGRSPISVSGISCAGKLFGGGSVMYIFPRFIEKGGKVLGVPPVMFRSGRGRGNGLSVRIGVHTRDITNASRHYGQYIEDTSQRPRDGTSGE